MQERFNCLLANRGIAYAFNVTNDFKGFNSLLLIYCNTLMLDAYANS